MTGEISHRQCFRILATVKAFVKPGRYDRMFQEVRKMKKSEIQVKYRKYFLPWTDKDFLFLIVSYPTLPKAQIIKRLERSWPAIREKAAVLNTKHPELKLIRIGNQPKTYEWEWENLQFGWENTPNYRNPILDPIFERAILQLKKDTKKG